MTALAIAVNTTIGITVAAKAPMVANFDRIVGATRSIATITKLVPLARVPNKVEMAGDIDSLLLRALYVNRHVTAPIGSLIRFAGGKME